MFKIISRKKYKELLEAQELANSLRIDIDALRLTIQKRDEEIDRLKARLNALYGVNKRSEDCIDDVYALLETISDKCNINALRAARIRLTRHLQGSECDEPSKIDGAILTEQLQKAWDHAIGPDPEEKEMNK